LTQPNWKIFVKKAVVAYVKDLFRYLPKATKKKKLPGEPGLRFETTVSSRVTQSKNCLTLADESDVVP
jgi:hypothetical protein